MTAHFHGSRPRTRRLAITVLASILVTGTAALITPLHAQTTWPSKPIRLVVAGPTGGSADTLARLLADGMQQSLDQPVIVESKAGASGALAIHDLKAKGQDGYTFLVIQDGALSEAPAAYKVSYDPFKDLKPLAQLTRQGQAPGCRLSHAPGLPAGGSYLHGAGLSPTIETGLVCPLVTSGRPAGHPAESAGSGTGPLPKGSCGQANPLYRHGARPAFEQRGHGGGPERRCAKADAAPRAHQLPA